MFRSTQSQGGGTAGPFFSPPSRAASGTYFQGRAGQQTSDPAYAAAAGGQAAKDQAAFGAMGTLGVAAQNAMGQYGVSRNNALAHSNIAAANAYGQMGNNYYNTMGQLGNIAGGLTAAGLNAGAASATASQAMGFGMGGGGGAGGGFSAYGPEGNIASGRMSGGAGGASGSARSSMRRGASSGERNKMVDQGYDFLGDLRGDLNSRGNQGMALAGLMGNEFKANRSAIMDPSITNALSGQLAGGYNALSGLYGMADYGLTSRARSRERASGPMPTAPVSPGGLSFEYVH